MDYSNLFNQGWIGTDFFLIVSGFVISRAFFASVSSGQISFRQFMKQRILRAWPTHAAIMLAFGLLVLGIEVSSPGLLPQGAYSLKSYVAQLFLLNAFIEPGLGWNYPTWTISAIIVCYMLFYLVVRKFSAASIRAVSVVALGGLIAGSLVTYAFSHGGFVDAQFAWRLARSIPLFFCGTLVERLTTTWVIRPGTYFALTAPILCLIVCLGNQLRSPLLDYSILAALVLLVSLSGAVWLTETPLTRRLGRASFCIYLIHIPVKFLSLGLSMMLFPVLSVHPMWGWVIFFGGLATVFLAGFAVDTWVDTPIQNLLHGTSRRGARMKTNSNIRQH